tara:strand:- start:284 stop:478 length:195 start_codon:yes stop_codon:yes gene_type:complete
MYVPFDITVYIIPSRKGESFLAIYKIDGHYILIFSSSIRILEISISSKKNKPILRAVLQGYVLV